jgi:hypothetical protein
MLQAVNHKINQVLTIFNPRFIFLFPHLHFFQVLIINLQICTISVAHLNLVSTGKNNSFADYLVAIIYNNKIS